MNCENKPLRSKKAIYIRVCEIAAILFGTVFLHINTHAKEFVISGQEMFTSVVCELILDKAFKNIGYEVGYEKFPSARALIVSNSGELDGETCRIAGADKKFKNLVKIPHSYMGFKGGVFVNKHHFNKKILAWEELNGVNIGIRRGHLFYDKPTSVLDQTKITKVSTDRQLLDMLEIGHIPVAVLILYDALEIIAKNPERYKNIAIVNDSLENHDLFLYIHNKNLEYYDIISNGINSVVEQGEAAKIRKDAEGIYDSLLQQLMIN